MAMKERDALWLAGSIVVGTPTDTHPALRSSGDGPASPAGKGSSGPKVASALRDGTRLCDQFQAGRCSRRNCNEGAHRCGRVLRAAEFVAPISMVAMRVTHAVRLEKRAALPVWGGVATKGHILMNSLWNCQMLHPWTMMNPKNQSCWTYMLAPMLLSLRPLIGVDGRW